MERRNYADKPLLGVTPTIKTPDLDKSKQDSRLNYVNKPRQEVNKTIKTPDLDNHKQDSRLAEYTQRFEAIKSDFSSLGAITLNRQLIDLEAILNKEGKPTFTTFAEEVAQYRKQHLVLEKVEVRDLIFRENFSPPTNLVGQQKALVELDEIITLVFFYGHRRGPLDYVGIDLIRTRDVKLGYYPEVHSFVQEIFEIDPNNTHRYSDDDSIEKIEESLMESQTDELNKRVISLVVGAYQTKVTPRNISLSPYTYITSDKREIEKLKIDYISFDVEIYSVSKSKDKRLVKK